MILHLLNGEAMREHLAEHNIILGEYVEPFNEAMCVGETTQDIFGGEFCEVRASEHGVIQEDYEETVLRPLENFLEMEYDELHMYFDEDMHCSINIITILAYLDRNAYEGSVFLHVINSKFDVLYDAAINVVGFYDVYDAVLINRIMPIIQLPKLLLNNILEYLNDKKFN